MVEKQSRKGILLVDDDPDYSELTCARLQAAGYQVTCASNGTEALKLLEECERPNLIIMDLEMPDRNGLTTLIHLGVRQKRGDNGKTQIPVVVATGLQSEKVQEIVTTQNISGYFKKPYSSEALLDVVKSLIA